MAILDGDNKSDIVEIANETRVKMTSKNNYNPQKKYDITSPDVFSDGDDKGRDDNGSGQIGTNIDINAREIMRAKNKYSPSKPYKEPID